MKEKLPILFEWLIPLITCFIGLHLTIIGICHYDLSMIPGDLGDARFNMYLLEHGYQYLTHQVHYLWGAPFFYPYSPALALSDNLLGTMPVYAVFRMLSFDRETAFQLWFIMLCILNFFTTFYVLKRLTRHTILASAGAYIFAFSVFLFCQYNHAQTFPRFIMPLVIYWVIRFFESHKIKYIWFIMLGILYQFYCAMYLGIYLGCGTMILFFVLFITAIKQEAFKKIFNAKNLLKTLFPIAAFILLIIPLTFYYWKLQATSGGRNYQDTFLTIPILKCYFFTAKESLTWHILSNVGIRDKAPWWDQEMFVGIIPWIAIIASILFAFKREFMGNNRILYSILTTLIILMLLTLRFGDFTLYKLLFNLPGIAAMGTVPRIMNLFLLFFAMIPCLFFNAVIRNKRNLWFSIILFAVIIENLAKPSEYESFNKKEDQKRIEMIVEKINDSDWTGKNAFAYMPNSGNEFEVQIDAMMASQVVHKPCVNGYSATSPRGFDRFWAFYNDKELDYWLDYNKVDHSTVLRIH